MKRNVLLTIEYDGSGFSGWQRQPDKRTVQGVLEEALGVFCQEAGTPVTLNGTSRTDAGVHALGQCASFISDSGIPVERIPIAVNHYLAGGSARTSQKADVRIVSAREMPMDFHARFNCRGKTYRYVIDNSGEPDIFRRNYCYSVTEALDPEEMKRGSEFIVGTHDFACFQSSGGNPRETTVRTIHDITINRKGKDVIIEVTGDGFLYNMVRIITGTLVEVGLGKRTPGSVADTVASKNRSKAGHTAPAAGLYLKEIYF